MTQMRHIDRKGRFPSMPPSLTSLPSVAREWASVSVCSTSGCSGMAYKLEFVDAVNPEDAVFESHGVKVMIDPKSLPYIDGTELDYVREGLNEGFKFNNPNVKDQCGCGESFNV
jgi:iron-sulfur cluster assembly protein